MTFSKKNHEHQKANKYFVSKNNYLTLLFIFSFCFGFAQTKDSLSFEEQQRRENNIQAGNPFKQFGYKPKIATLSKGKYLEFHDLDSIVKIGSFTYHVKRKLITGYTKLETKYSEATLNPEIISRWMSPDPLSSEFPSWSPYNYVMNNPLRFVDPTGMAPEDWVATLNDNGTKTWEWKEEIKSASQAKDAGYDDYKSPSDNYTFIDTEGTKQKLGNAEVIMENPLQQHLYSDKTLTLNDWVAKNGNKSQSALALEIGKDKFGLPLGPVDRYVINPHDGNVMDMRHVAVVGYAMGEVNGLGAEIIQKVAGIFGKDPTNSAFNPQDKYSNNIGSSFFNYDYHNYGLDMSNNFGNRFQQFLNTVYENNNKN